MLREQRRLTQEHVQDQPLIGFRAGVGGAGTPWTNPSRMAGDLLAGMWELLRGLGAVSAANPG